MSAFNPSISTNVDVSAQDFSDLNGGFTLTSELGVPTKETAQHQDGHIMSIRLVYSQ
ncbi:hypothetical protein [Nostoc sp. ChiSLP03a]|uniref:hypothetical protein n=1 Tax=Nostoc sp. ChiSLP03a TaxID=3075380 RepID=UPI002AD1D204|nr:hypothetical protein [Nostoc sp. ChiSLP03a]MDZ8212330.1 hypothetical protein [Nostoc sp. ChiSLP03a]